MTARRPTPATANNTPANSSGTSNATAATNTTTPAKNSNLRPRSTRVQRSSGSAASECVRLAARRFSFLVGGNRRVRPVSSARRRRENRRLGATAAAKTTAKQQQQQVQVRPASSSPAPVATTAATTITTANTTINNNNNLTASTTNNSNSINVSAQTTSPSSPSRREISESFEIWALKTYGDSAKTKTVTRRKYVRISRILRGEEQNSAENSKFRFWVKAKGFRLGPPPSATAAATTSPDTPSSSSPDVMPTPYRTGGGGGGDGGGPDPVLYVPCAQAKGGDDNEDTVYKKVAVVENFFDIIYNVHVEMDGRGGKHAGQKRTYKAIAETYAFLPREAVTKFLMQCSDCQKRMHAAGSGGSTGTTAAQLPAAASTPVAANGNPSPVPSASPSPPLQDVAIQTPLPSPHPPPGNCNNSHPPGSPSASSGSSSPSSLCADPPQIDFSLPITTTYLKHMRSLGYTEEDALNPEREDCTSNADSESSSGEGPTPIGDSDVPSSPHTPTIKEEVDKMRTASFSSPTASHFASEHSYDRPVNMTKSQPQELSPVSSWPSTAPINMSKNGVARSLQDHTYDESVVSPCMNGVVRGQVHSHLVNREATSTPEDLSGGTKDDEDDDDDDNDEKLDSNKYDPERLKAFNMFVRLFVDENLDRMVPISKQPKEKIQAIIDSCNRQFPEFAERARKRIRTYLKSCRRTKRTRDQNGWDLVRPTPPHLTSAMAEQILASACENESNNAKRMRLGMDPLSAAIQTGHTSEPSDKEHLQGGAGVVRMDTMDCAAVRLHSPPVVTSTASPATAPLPRISPQLNGSLVSATSATPFHATSVTSQQAAQPTAAAAALPTSGSGHSNGPTDLTVKKSCPSGGTTKCSLNPTEVLAVKQLVAGYRESAAFLIRSADELEQLLLQQN